MNFDQFIKKVKSQNPKADTKLIKEAYELAKKAHEGQIRVGGDPYFVHPVGVAEILVDLRADTATICAALLHDVPEDTPIKIEEIEKKFGETIAELVNGMTKIAKLKFRKWEDYRAENYRKILLASAKDIRVMLIKLADRLHNMRTLKDLREDKQKRIAEETMSVYAPIAYKLGVGYIKGELEDLSLRYLEPKVYQYLKARISEKRVDREAKTEKIIEEIKDLLKKNKIQADVSGRAKYFYSIYQKMKKDNKTFDDIYDLVGVRILTNNLDDCYKAFKVIHSKWDPDIKRFKDFINKPKHNGYQSLHTTVKGPYNKELEIQVRTKEMNDYAEEGIAAHWKYKGGEKDKKFEKKISWIKQLLHWKRTDKDALDIIEDLNMNLFADEIITFTPKGDPISLPVNSTPVDFAYAVHTNLGKQCNKSKVNGNITPLSHKLESGDTVEIIIKKNSTPNRQWLNFVKSSMAKSKIRQALNMPLDKPKKDIHPDEQHQLIMVDQIEIIGKKYPLKISKCCIPQKTDKIIGFLTKDKKITVHKKGCFNIKDKKKEVQLLWKKLEDKYEKEFVVVANDTPGFIRNVLNIITHARIIIKAVDTKNSKGHIMLKLKVHSTDEAMLKDALRKIRRIEESLDVRLES